MRLSEIRTIIKCNESALVPNMKITGDGHFYVISGIKSTMTALEDIKKIPSLKNLAQKILDMQEVSSVWTDEAASIPKAQAENFRNCLSRIRSDCSVITALADSILPSMDENLLCIRLSDKVTDLAELKKLVDNIEKAFQLTYGTKSYEGHIRFAGVEAGTNWLNLIIDTAPYAALIYTLIKSAYTAVQDYYELKAMQKKYSTIDALNQINNSNANLVTNLNESLLAKQRADGNLDVSDEEFTKLCKASQMFSQIVMDGSKILLSLEAPKEKQIHILDAVKLIEAKQDEVRQLEAPKDGDDI